MKFFVTMFSLVFLLYYFWLLSATNLELMLSCLLGLSFLVGDALPVISCLIKIVIIVSKAQFKH